MKLESVKVAAHQQLVMSNDSSVTVSLPGPAAPERYPQHYLSQDVHYDTMAVAKNTRYTSSANSGVGRSSSSTSHRYSKGNTATVK